MAESPAVVCQICKQPKSPDNGTIGEVVRPSLSDFIKKKDPQWDGKGFICFDDLGTFRRDYVKEVLEDEIGELSALDHEVVQSLQAHEILSSDISKQFEKKLTFGERLSDTIAALGGSWTFIIFFSVVLLLWVVLNSFVLATRAFDPDPYILMNLVLSALAALQAPIIMMSQNRAKHGTDCAAKTIIRSTSKPNSKSGISTRKSITCFAASTIAFSRSSKSRSSCWKN